MDDFDYDKEMELCQESSDCRGYYTSQMFSQTCDLLSSVKNSQSSANPTPDHPNLKKSPVKSKLWLTSATKKSPNKSYLSSNNRSTERRHSEKGNSILTSPKKAREVERNNTVLKKTINLKDDSSCKENSLHNKPTARKEIFTQRPSLNEKILLEED